MKFNGSIGRIRDGIVLSCKEQVNMISEYVNLMKEIIESDIEKRIINTYVENNKDAIFDKINNLVEEELGNKPSSHFTDMYEAI